MQTKYRILNELARKGHIFRFEDAAGMGGIKRQSLKVMLSRMEKEGLIERIEKGKYLIIPPGARKGRYLKKSYSV